MYTLLLLINVLIMLMTVQYGRSQLVDNRCLDCFCQAQTSCNTELKCVKKTVILCGPYLLSYPYWIDGGKLNNFDEETEFDDFTIGARNKLCSEQAIQNYMKMYQKDCDDNKAVDCVDFYRIHLGGPGGCTLSSIEKKQEWLKFLECYLNTASNITETLNKIGITDHQ